MEDVELHNEETWRQKFFEKWPYLTTLFYETAADTNSKIREHTNSLEAEFCPSINSQGKSSCGSDTWSESRDDRVTPLQEDLPQMSRSRGRCDTGCQRFLLVFLLLSIVGGIGAGIGLSIYLTHHVTNDDSTHDEGQPDGFFSRRETSYLEAKLCSMLSLFLKASDFPVHSGLADCHVGIQLEEGSEDLFLEVKLSPARGYTLKQKFRRALREQLLAGAIYKIRNSKRFLHTNEVDPRDYDIMKTMVNNSFLATDRSGGWSRYVSSTGTSSMSEPTISLSGLNIKASALQGGTIIGSTKVPLNVEESTGVGSTIQPTKVVLRTVPSETIVGSSSSSASSRTVGTDLSDTQLSEPSLSDAVTIEPSYVDVIPSSDVSQDWLFSDWFDEFNTASASDPSAVATLSASVVVGTPPLPSQVSRSFQKRSVSANVFNTAASVKNTQTTWSDSVYSTRLSSGSDSISDTPLPETTDTAPNIVRRPAYSSGQYLVSMEPTSSSSVSRTVTATTTMQQILSSVTSSRTDSRFESKLLEQTPELSTDTVQVSDKTKSFNERVTVFDAEGHKLSDMTTKPPHAGKTLLAAQPKPRVTDEIGASTQPEIKVPVISGSNGKVLFDIPAPKLKDPKVIKGQPNTDIDTKLSSKKDLDKVKEKSPAPLPPTIPVVKVPLDKFGTHGQFLFKIPGIDLHFG